MEGRGRGDGEVQAIAPLDVIAPRSLVSPLQVETALGKALHDLIQKDHGGKNKQGKKVTKKACNEEAEEIVAPYAEKPEGFPTLVKDADARPALGPVFTGGVKHSMQGTILIAKAVSREGRRTSGARTRAPTT
jgi:hypothetical protein